MIIYSNSSFGFRNLLRVHGSPVYKVLFPTLVSTGFLLLVDYLREDAEENIVQHPYTVGAFIGFFSFLLTFRLNFAYQRYWEGATAVHQMLSKWVDVAMLLAAFHYQADSFNDVKPPAFGNHPTAMAVDLQRQRVQNNASSMEETMSHVQNLQQQEMQQQQQKRGLLGVRRRKQAQQPQTDQQDDTNNTSSQRQTSSHSHVHIDINTHEKVVAKSISSASKEPQYKYVNRRIPIPLRFQERFQAASAAANTESPNPQQPVVEDAIRHGQQGSSSRAERSTSILKSRHVQMPAPSLFFQELAHLVSLLSGVAMSTLRCDIEGMEAPIVEYIPGKPWPPVDPDALSKDMKHQYGGDNTFWQAIYFMFGLTRSDRHRTLYNAARPFTVLGGVSDDEVEQLDRAKGPYAKVALCTMWLQEFISREMLHGSVGKIHHALLSRLYQYASDGCIGFNQARKVAYIPFPFPHGQMTAFFSFTIIFIFPAFFQSYINELWFACFMNTLTVLCFLGLHEVARELENPFINTPNDLPLTTFQAQINEALVCMYAGYHPDAWWSIVTPASSSHIE